MPAVAAAGSPGSTRPIPNYEHHLLEALWVHEHHDRVEPAAADAAARGEGVPRPRRGGARAAALVRSRRRRDGAAGADGRQGSGAARAARGRARAQLRADRRGRRAPRCGVLAQADGLLPAVRPRLDDDARSSRCGSRRSRRGGRSPTDNPAGLAFVLDRLVAGRAGARQAQRRRSTTRCCRGRASTRRCAARGARRARDAERHARCCTRSSRRWTASTATPGSAARRRPT